MAVLVMQGPEEVVADKIPSDGITRDALVELANDYCRGIGVDAQDVGERLVCDIEKMSSKFGIVIEGDVFKRDLSKGRNTEEAKENAARAEKIAEERKQKYFDKAIDDGDFADAVLSGLVHYGYCQNAKDEKEKAEGDLRECRVVIKECCDNAGGDCRRCVLASRQRKAKVGGVCSLFEEYTRARRDLTSLENHGIGLRMSAGLLSNSLREAKARVEFIENDLRPIESELKEFDNRRKEIEKRIEDIGKGL